MFYAWNLKLTHGKTVGDYTKKILGLEHGIINRVEVIFPKGCANLVYVHIDDALHQVYPKNPDYQLIGDGLPIIVTDEYRLAEEPFDLQFYGCNTDDTFDHTVTVRIQLLPAKEITRIMLGEISKLMALSR